MRSSMAACASSPSAFARTRISSHGRCGELVVQRAAGEGLGAGAQLGPVAEGQPRGALGVAEAQARAGLRGRRLDARAAGAAISSALGASKRTCWQREAIVGRISPGRSVSSTRCAKAAGSSSVLSIRLAAWSFIVSARSMTNTRRRASNGVRVAAATTGSSMSETSISRGAAGRHPGEVGMHAVLHARADRVRVRRRRRPAARRRRRARPSPCPSPPGPWNR